MIDHKPLRVVLKEIESNSVLKDHDQSYLSKVFQLLRCEVTISEFFERTKEVPTDLNDRFLNAISLELESTILGKIAPSNKNIVFMPGPRKIKTYLMLYMYKFGIQEFEQECAMIIFHFIRNQIASILEAVIRLARQFKMTECGFPHSFGVTRPGQMSISASEKFIIIAEDVVDALDFENELVPHHFLLMSLVK